MQVLIYSKAILSISFAEKCGTCTECSIKTQKLSTALFACWLNVKCKLHNRENTGVDNADSVEKTCMSIVWWCGILQNTYYIAIFDCVISLRLHML